MDSYHGNSQINNFLQELSQPLYVHPPSAINSTKHQQSSIKKGKTKIPKAQIRRFSVGQSKGKADA